MLKEEQRAPRNPHDPCTAAWKGGQRVLILSRRRNEKILFPGIHTAVQILAVKGNTVRLGIEAPPDVTVLRAELSDRHAESGATAAPAEPAEARFRALRHLVRNRLNGATIGLALLRQQVTAGRTNDLDRTVGLIEQEMQKLREQVEGKPAPAADPPQPSRKLRKALVVEDDQNERELLAGFLRVSGFDVDTAGDGCDALDYLRAGRRPDVVLLDMGLPRCDGATTAREIRRDPACAGLKIFAVTGHSPDEYDLEKGPGGIDRWFPKPVDPVLLVRELTQELRRA
jgi:carbon storage regulator CsrA